MPTLTREYIVARTVARLGVPGTHEALDLVGQRFDETLAELSKSKVTFDPAAIPIEKAGLLTAMLAQRCILDFPEATEPSGPQVPEPDFPSLRARLKAE